MKIESDTYAIIKYRGKPKLAYVLNGKSRKAVLNDSLCTDEPINFTFDADQVMCALGDAPEQGTLYGVKVEPFLKTVETEKYGPIHFFRYMKPREKEALKTAMRAVYEFYQKNISVDFLPLNGLFIRNAKGKYAGSYKAMTRANEWKDQITFHPKDFSDANYNVYLVAHEFAHGVWFRCVPHRVKAKWIKLYDKRMRLNEITEDYLTDLCKSIISYEGGMNAYIKEVADDEEREVIKEIITYFKKHHGLGRDNVELLIEYDSEKLAKIWPHVALLTEKRVDISQYATTKVEEFFAEALAYHVTGKSLPADITKAIEATIKTIS